MAGEDDGDAATAGGTKTSATTVDPFLAVLYVLAADPTFAEIKWTPDNDVLLTGPGIGALKTATGASANQIFSYLTATRAFHPTTDPNGDFLFSHPALASGGPKALLCFPCGALEPHIERSCQVLLKAFHTVSSKRDKPGSATGAAAPAATAALKGGSQPPQSPEVAATVTAEEEGVVVRGAVVKANSPKAANPHEAPQAPVAPLNANYITRAEFDVYRRNVNVFATTTAKGHEDVVARLNSTMVAANQMREDLDRVISEFGTFASDVVAWKKVVTTSFNTVVDHINDISSWRAKLDKHHLATRGSDEAMAARTRALEEAVMLHHRVLNQCAYTKPTVLEQHLMMAHPPPGAVHVVTGQPQQSGHAPALSPRAVPTVPRAATGHTLHLQVPRVQPPGAHVQVPQAVRPAALPVVVESPRASPRAAAGRQQAGGQQQLAAAAAAAAAASLQTRQDAEIARVRAASSPKGSHTVDAAELLRLQMEKANARRLADAKRRETVAKVVGSRSKQSSRANQARNRTVTAPEAAAAQAVSAKPTQADVRDAVARAAEAPDGGPQHRIWPVVQAAAAAAVASPASPGAGITSRGPGGIVLGDVTEGLLTGGGPVPTQPRKSAAPRLPPATTLGVGRKRTAGDDGLPPAKRVPKLEPGAANPAQKKHGTQAS